MLVSLFIRMIAFVQFLWRERERETETQIERERHTHRELVTDEECTKPQIGNCHIIIVNTSVCELVLRLILLI